MIKFNPTTHFAFYQKIVTYTAGVGTSAVWTLVGTLYGEWRGAYGTRLTEAQALGVSDSATVRTYFHPDIYDALLTKDCLIVRNGNQNAFNANGIPQADCADLYELWAGVDNVSMENQFMEFSVRRYEAK